MNIDKISVGVNPPYDFHVIIEIPQGGYPVKYEMNKESGAMFVDRFLNTSMTYPANYGFIPHTLAADGDPCDVLVLSRSPVIPGAVIRARAVGALVMTDEAGADDKIIAVPIDKLNPYYAEVQSPDDLPRMLKEQVAHFFQHYKDLEKGKWVAGLRWVGPEEALALVMDGIKRARHGKKPAASRGRTAAVGKAPKAAPRTKAQAAPKAPPKTKSSPKAPAKAKTPAASRPATRPKATSGAAPAAKTARKGPAPKPTKK